MTKGDRVEATPEAFKCGVFRRQPPVFGTVVGNSRSGEGVYVRLDGNKAAYQYRRTFWERIDPARGYIEREGWLRCECGWRYQTRCPNPLHWPTAPRVSSRGLALEVVRPEGDGAA